MGYKLLLESDILRAMRVTQSNSAAAKYLGVAKSTYKKYASMYRTDDGFETLYESHLNQSGLGIPKTCLNYQGFKYSLEDILAGKHPTYPIQRLRNRLISEGFLDEKCEMCGLEERRLTDFRIPLLLSFTDGDNTNWDLDNLQLLCYNCYFFNVGNIIGKRGTTELF